MGQDDAVIGVAEGDLLEGDVSAGCPQVDGVDGVGNCRFLLENPRDLLKGRGRSLVRVQEHRDLLQGREEVADVQHTRQQDADLERPVNDA